MKSKGKSVIVISILLSTLLTGTLLPNIIMAQETVTGTQDDTTGVWLFSAGTDKPAGAPTSDIIKAAIDYDILDYIGDSAGEVYDFDYGPSEPNPGYEDKTLPEVIEGLSAIDDFGYISYTTDDYANFDTGSDGYFLGGVDLTDPYVIVSDGILATGELGPSGAANAVEAEEALSGYEMFIFEDAELSGMIVTLSNTLGLSITFSLEDLQINPPTPYGADDTLIAIDLDNLPGFDPTVDFIETIRIEDDSVTSPSKWGDTTLEIDAIATKKPKKPDLGSIGDTVWLDENRDGVQDAGESGVPGVTVNLVGLASTTTVGNGYYLFGNLPADNYTVQVQVPIGYEATTVTSYIIDLGVGEDYLDADFGIAPRLVLPASISGVKFKDCNENEIQDPGEPGIEGATILLETTTPDSPIANTTTDQDGYYEFLNLPPGNYIVIQIDLPGYYSTTPNEVTVTLDPGEHEEVNFGDAIYSKIYGVKFEDLNENGDLDYNEPGIENATIKLFNSTGHEIATITTDVDGYYEFTDLMSGDYTVVHEDLEGYFNTTSNEVPVTLDPCQQINVNFGDARESCGDICHCCWKCIICCAEKSTGRVREFFVVLIVRINNQSTVFSEVYTISSIEDACDLLSDCINWKKLALKELLICWLNWANCAIRMNQMVDTNCDGKPDMTFGEAMTIVEEILSNPYSTSEQLRRAYYICYYINTCN